MKSPIRKSLCLTMLLLITRANALDLAIGKGKFVFDDTTRHPIDVHYFIPSVFDSDSKIILVIPGSGRNGADYRDAWVDSAKKNKWFVLSPSYSEKHYPRFWNYNLVRMIEDVKINDARTAIESFSVNDDPSTWICNDFDALFLHIKNKLALSTASYNAFGHSAGGQILHRCVLSGHMAKADLILASNAGWYTTPEFEEPFPYGLGGAPFSKSTIGSSFQKRLVVFLGEKDNENETRGHLVRNMQIDKQGTHRLQRGMYFYRTSKEYASRYDTTFIWQIHVVPNVGHDYFKMSEAAAKFLETTY